MTWQFTILLAVALAALVAAGIFARRRRRLRRALPARRAPRLRHPVVLAHGVLGFDEIFAALDKSIADRAEMKPSRRKELERLVADSRRQAKSFVDDMERTMQQITAREETGKGDR